jgi:uncharacterized protein
MTLRVPEPIWQLLYNGANITADIAPHVTQVEWCERVGGQAAEISVIVEDSGGKWRGSSYPQVGTDSVALSIGYAGAPLLDCGTFIVDELEFNGLPDTVTLKATEFWTTAPVRTAGSYAYEGMTFSQIAQAVAGRHGWTVVGLPTTPDAPWQRRTQTLEHGGDVNFLRKLANEANYEFNIRPPNIIFYSRPAIDSQAPANTITREMVTRYSFRYQTAADNTFGISTVSYLDPTTKQVHYARVRTSGTPPTADNLNIVERVENSQQAALKASSRLVEHNMLLYQLTVTLPGTIQFRAGQVVALSKDWGTFAGSWTCSRATHRIRARGGGYVTELLLRQAVPGTVLTPGGATP